MRLGGRRAGVLATALALAATAAPVAAQPAKDPGQAAYEEGRRLYDLREWDAAIAKFKEAYRLRSDAPSLFNIAQAYRLKGDCVEAVNFYKTFLRNFPAAKGADKAKKFVAELEPCPSRRSASPDPSTTSALTPRATRTEPTTSRPDATTTTPSSTPTTSIPANTPRPEEPTSPPPRGGTLLRVSGMVAGAAGFLAIGGGVYYGAKARTAQDELDASMVWSQALYDRGERYDRSAKVLFLAGGASVVVGTVLFTLGVRAGREPQLAVVPTSGGGTLVWSCGF